MAFAVGINLGGNVPFDTSHFWPDMAMYFRPWKALVGGGTVALSPAGYPLADATTSTVCGDYPAGVYGLRFRGTATPSVSGRGAVLGPVVQGGDGVSRATVTLAVASSALLTLNLAGIDPADPPSDLHLIEPGYDADAPPKFNPNVVRRLKPFACTRYMTWSGVNTSNLVDWSDRVLPTSFLQAGGGGVAYETICDLANLVGRDIWINVPDQATDDYITRMADLFRDGLDPAINVYLEYSNETWNTGFAHHARIRTAALADPTITAKADLGKVGQWSARRLVQAARIWRAEWGGRAASIRPVLQGQSNQTTASYAGIGIAFLSKLGYTPAAELYGVCIGPYVALTAANDVPGLTVDGVFASTAANLAGAVMTGVRAHRAAAAAVGLKVLAYEGGQTIEDTRTGPTGAVVLNHAPKLAAQLDPRMGDLHRDLFDAWSAAGGDLFCVFCQCSLWDGNGYWGLLSTQSAPGSFKWDAVLSYVVPPGDVNLDGVADYADAQVVLANKGKTGLWREQGDLTAVGPDAAYARFLAAEAAADTSGAWVAQAPADQSRWVLARAAADQSGSWRAAVVVSGLGSVDSADVQVILDNATLTADQRAIVEAAL